jgi:hypothetical protein
MRIVFWSIAIVTCFVAFPVGGQEKNDNPLKNAKLGDFAVYKVTLKADDRIIEVIVKKQVIAKSDTEVTLNLTSTEMGKPRTPEKQKIDITKPYDPLTVMGRAHKFEKTGDGKEKLKIGDKSYDCNWITGKQVNDSKVKVWSSTSVPVLGVVKADFAGILLMELTDYGNAKLDAADAGGDR